MRKHALLGGSGGMPPRKFLKNGLFWDAFRRVFKYLNRMKFPLFKVIMQRERLRDVINATWTLTRLRHHAQCMYTLQPRALVGSAALIFNYVKQFSLHHGVLLWKSCIKKRKVFESGTKNVIAIWKTNFMWFARNFAGIFMSPFAGKSCEKTSTFINVAQQRVTVWLVIFAK